MEYSVGPELSVTTQVCSVLDSDICRVELASGSLWTPVRQDERTVGLAAFGRGHLVLDAILETDEGAVGESVTVYLEGAHVILGGVLPQSESRPATDDDVSDAGFSELSELHRTATDLLDEPAFQQLEYTSSRHRLVFGTESAGRRVIFVTDDVRAVLLWGDDLVALTREMLLRIGNGRLSVAWSDGREIVLGHGRSRHSILRHLCRVGPTMMFATGIFPQRRLPWWDCSDDID